VLKAELAASEKRLNAIRKSPLGADVSIPLRSPREGLLRSVSVASGQIVSAGAPMFEILGTPALWVRASVYAGEAPRIPVEVSARIATIGSSLSTKDVVIALPVSAPPSADPVKSVVDFYYELPPTATRRPGERVTVFLTTNHSTDMVMVPFSAVVFDAVGGAWIYAEKTEHAYERRRIDIARIEDDVAVLAIGPAAATRIVRAGASELFGVEFGVGK
jgi:multidrug efflux pump subunit AcrA (membrane-fusion protein)